MLLIIGAGGVGQAIARRLHEAGESVGILHRPYQSPDVPVSRWSDLDAVPWDRIQVAFLCTKDAQIAPTAKAIAPRLPAQAILLHTAGSVPLSVLTEQVGERAGVVYPLQSFIVGETVQWGTFPVFWEGHPAAQQLAQRLTGDPTQVHFADSEARLRLHIGAVFTANFLNALFHMGGRLSPLPEGWKIYLPLAETILRRLHTTTPEAAQTGPARRGDETTLQTHLTTLKNTHPDLAQVYALLTAYIRNHLKEAPAP